MTKFAGLLEALPRNFAYALSALIEKGGAGDAPAAAPTDTAEESADDVAPEESETDAAVEASSDESPTTADDAADAAPTTEEA